MIEEKKGMEDWFGKFSISFESIDVTIQDEDEVEERMITEESEGPIDRLTPLLLRACSNTFTN